METYNLIIWARDLEKYWVHFELGLKGIQDKNSALHCNDAYFWWTNFYYFLKVMSVADFQTDLNDISCKKYRKISQSKIMQHCSYLGCPLIHFWEKIIVSGLSYDPVTKIMNCRPSLKIKRGLWRNFEHLKIHFSKNMSGIMTCTKHRTCHETSYYGGPKGEGISNLLLNPSKTQALCWKG